MRAFAFLCLLSVSLASHLVYFEVPAQQSSSAFVTSLAQKGVDIRGDRTTYVLAVSSNTAVLPSGSHMIFEDYQPFANAYFVLEPSSPTSIVSLSEFIFLNYRWTAVKGTYLYSLSPPSPSFEFTPSMVPYPVIADLVAKVSSADLSGYLTGEASSLITRQSQSEGAVEAAKYIEGVFQSYGFSVQQQPFREGYSSNVVATWPGTLYPEQLVLVACHYDDRGPVLTSKTGRAPGANDNGSGTGALLQIAKIIYENKVQFDYTVVLIAFSGEEQGLYGSAYSAKQYFASQTKIVAVLNADMIAYRAPGAPAQVDFVSRSTSASLTVAVANITNTYVPKLAVGSTTACCTDSASFYDAGYAAVSFCEKGGYTVDPMYHKEGDLVVREGYDLTEQYPMIVQAMLAGLLTIAKINV